MSKLATRDESPFITDDENSEKADKKERGDEKSDNIDRV